MAARRALRDSDSSEESEEEEDGGGTDNESEAEAGDNPPPEEPAGNDSEEHQQEDADVDKASQPSEDMQARETAHLPRRIVAVTLLRCGQGSTGAASSAEAVRPASAPSMGSGGGGWSDMEVEEMPSPGDGRNDATKETPKFVSRAQSMAASLVSYWACARSTDPAWRSF